MTEALLAYEHLIVDLGNGAIQRKQPNPDGGWTAHIVGYLTGQERDQIGSIALRAANNQVRRKKEAELEKLRKEVKRLERELENIR